jgi:acyl-CoA synthetase (AMP-forming)/AMP-acid ligase II/uncharacterized membrane protein
MRVEQSIVIDAPCDKVWEVVSDPDFHARIPSISRWEVEGRKKRGLGARYQLRMNAGSAQVGSLVEVVEWDPPRDLAWTSLMGIDQRVRWRLRTMEDGTTKVTFRLSYHAPGGLLGAISDRVGAPIVRRNLREGLELLKQEVEGNEEDMASSEESQGIVGRARTSVGDGLHAVRTFAGAGLIRAERPDRIARALLAVNKWGNTAAAGYVANAARYPDTDAIIDELGRLTFKEVDERSNRLANAWSDAGLLEGDQIALMCRNHRYFIEATVAAAKLGVTCLYLNTQFAGPQLAEVVDREKPKAIVYDEEFTELLGDAGKRRKRFIGWVDSDDPADPTLEQLVEQGDPALPVPPEKPGRVTILTSGTTGTPKGASRGEPETWGPGVAILSRIPMQAREKTMVAAPLFHMWGYAHFSLGLLLASTLVLRRKFSPEGTLQAIAEHECTCCPMVPVMVQRIMDLPEETRKKYDVSSLRVVPLSGSALPGDLAVRFMDEFGDILYNIYGSTEVTTASIATPEDLRAAPGTAGKVPRGTVVKIYDENGNEMPPGKDGRIFVGNELLFEGYTGGGSKDVINGLMSTGDLGHFDSDGRLMVSGRDDEMIVSGGENVFPREVEDLLAKHKKVSDVAVVGVDDEKFGQRLKAFVVPKNGKPSADELKSYVKSNLAAYKVPRDFVFIEEVPRNATGKVLKKELQEKYGDEAEKEEARSKG